MTLTRVIKALLALQLIALAGCTPEIHYITKPVVLPMPVSVTLPRIKSSEWVCPQDIHKKYPEILCPTDATYDKLLERERLLRLRGDSGAAIIKKNNEAAQSTPVQSH